MRTPRRIPVDPAYLDFAISGHTVPWWDWRGDARSERLEVRLYVNLIREAAIIAGIPDTTPPRSLKGWMDYLADHGILFHLNLNRREGEFSIGPLCHHDAGWICRPSFED